MTSASACLNAESLQILPHLLLVEVEEPIPYNTTRPEVNEDEYSLFLVSIMAPDCGGSVGLTEKRLKNEVK